MDPSRLEHVTPVELHRQITAVLPELRGFARFLVRNPSASDDLVQETLVRALAALGQFRQGTNVRAWLFTILRNTFYEQNRRRLTEERALERAAPPDEASSAPQEAETELADLQRLLWALPPTLREALVLVGAQGLAYEEAAQICNVPVGTVKARVSRARRQITASLEAAPMSVTESS